MHRCCGAYAYDDTVVLVLCFIVCVRAIIVALIFIDATAATGVFMLHEPKRVVFIEYDGDRHTTRSITDSTYNIAYVKPKQGKR